MADEGSIVFRHTREYDWFKSSTLSGRTHRQCQVKYNAREDERIALMKGISREREEEAVEGIATQPRVNLTRLSAGG